MRTIDAEYRTLASHLRGPALALIAPTTHRPATATAVVKQAHRHTPHIITRAKNRSIETDCDNKFAFEWIAAIACVLPCRHLFQTTSGPMDMGLVSVDDFSSRSWDPPHCSDCRELRVLFRVQYGIYIRTSPQKPLNARSPFGSFAQLLMSHADHNPSCEGVAMEVWGQRPQGERHKN